MANRTQILIDTDLGDDVDDALAIIMALQSPELEIVGITTVFGDTQKRAEMVMDLFGKCQRKDVPVYVGHGEPLVEKLTEVREPIQYSIVEQVHTVNREMSAVDFILQSVKEYPDITIIAMGAMTNLAMAFYRDPEIMKAVKIVAMGGIFNQSVPEWNMQCDPEAARIVMNYAENLIMFGLEVTKHCTILEEKFQKIKERGSQQIAYFLKGVELFCQKTGFPVTLHDVALIAYLLNPEVAVLKKSDYTIELAGNLTRGGIVHKGNAYQLETEAEKEFYYVQSIDLELFEKIVIEKIS